MQDKLIKDALALGMNLTKGRVAGIMRNVYDPEVFSEKEIVAFAEEAWKDVKRFTDKIDLTQNVNLPAFCKKA